MMADDILAGPARSLTEAEQQSLAIERLLAVFAEAPALGIAPEKMAIVALSAAVNNMVAVFGETKAAAILSTVPEKILAGNFTTRPQGTMQ
ncbi:MAG: hypothetical protein H7841_07240 [Magnetospirillum sp. WYHS-4]